MATIGTASRKGNELPVCQYAELPTGCEGSLKGQVAAAGAANGMATAYCLRRRQLPVQVHPHDLIYPGGRSQIQEMTHHPTQAKNHGHREACASPGAQLPARARQQNLKEGPRSPTAQDWAPVPDPRIHAPAHSSSFDHHFPFPSDTRTQDVHDSAWVPAGHPDHNASFASAAGRSRVA
eukprot:CAMPEP_0114539642 /NCGR_PEP_ID=MMETSP0114-20121206/346_1 /TAXON_ID=31324 /ORGANISM="Goniomonas sp, Strain m" /LENGTH=178 /DNA_ID=CAMNT_0001723757 /DNA_START=1107 /DNA_END=1644 /DNA_ORIENTATION=-